MTANVPVTQPAGRIMARGKASKRDGAGSEPGIDAARNSPELMTESELVRYLRIPEVSRSKDYRNVVENLKRVHGLPRVHICGKPLYPRKAIREWIEKKTTARE